MSQPLSKAKRSDYPHRHLRFGWWSLLVFLTLGILLEAMHGLKLRWYLDVTNETRRLMFTLAHAHGVLLSVVHIIMGLTLRNLAVVGAPWRRWTYPLMVAASILMPGGFLLGGVFIYDGDPGFGVLLVPLGAVALFIAVLLIARGVMATSPPDERPAEAPPAEYSPPDGL